MATTIGGVDKQDNGNETNKREIDRDTQTANPMDKPGSMFYCGPVRVLLSRTDRVDSGGAMMDFNAGNIQTPQEMIERWDNIPCTCDPDSGHLCEICHDTEVVRRLMAQAIIVAGENNQTGGIDDT